MSNKNRLTDIRLTWTDRIFLTPLVLYLLVLVFEGALRYYLWYKNLVELVYIPKALMFGLFWLAPIVDLAHRRPNKTFLILVGAIAGSFLFGWHTTQNFMQTAFGVWVYAPMLYGVLALPSFLKSGTRGTSFVLVLWLVSLVGVLLDFVLPFPWTGFNYDLGKALIEASRDWTTFGIERCAGFARASYSAAYLILFFAIYLGSVIKNKVMITVIWLISGVGLLMTTHKTAIGIYVLLTFLWPSIWHSHRWRVIQKLYKIFPMLIALIGISLPLLSKILIIRASSYFGEIALNSMGMRLADTWPDALSLIFERGNLILGRGLGGIGAPQRYFETAYYNPADNMYLYLYASFGIGMFILVAFWVRGLSKLDIMKDGGDRLFWLFGTVILIEGWTVNAVEDPLAAMILGLTLCYIFSQKRRHAAITRQSFFSAPSSFDNRRPLGRARDDYMGI